MRKKKCFYVFARRQASLRLEMGFAMAGKAQHL
jgi:hypothetical protein